MSVEQKTNSPKVTHVANSEVADLAASIEAANNASKAAPKTSASGSPAGDMISKPRVKATLAGGHVIEVVNPRK